MTTLTAWAHHGKPAEWKTIQEQVAAFNKTHDTVKIKLIEIAEGNYDTQVQSAAASDDLPDILEFDGPMLANYAWKGYLVPIGDLLQDELMADILPSIKKQGMYADKFYATGMFDSGLCLYANRSMLRQVDARIPAGYEDAWTIDEFNTILHRLHEAMGHAEKGKGILDLKRDYRGEWWTYGFYPTLVSGGADLIDRQTYETAEGVLNSENAVDVLSHIGGWVENGYVDRNKDGNAFTDERAAISWTGHWEYPRYKEALGDNLLLLPLPDFGQGTRTGSGSWCWGITRNCEDPDKAVAFLEFIMATPQITKMIKANGAVPATQKAIRESTRYRQDGPLHLFVEQLRNCAVPRPRTPAYPVITSAFQEAMRNILEGSDVQAQLDEAAQTIEADIAANRGYPEQSQR